MGSWGQGCFSRLASEPLDGFEGPRTAGILHHAPHGQTRRMISPHFNAADGRFGDPS